jgi:YgiT-type zinc finger domain-containing protein
MSEPEDQTAEAPACERCGASTYATTRRMRTHDITGRQAVPRDVVAPVWRCPRCGREMPRH